MVVEFDELGPSFVKERVHAREQANTLETEKELQGKPLDDPKQKRKHSLE